MPRKKGNTKRSTPHDVRRSASPQARAADVLYAYGFVPRTFDLQGAPAGLEDAAVQLAEGRAHSALVSRLSATEYSATEVSRLSGDIPWLTPRATAHDRVLTWAQEHGGVIPLPMFSLWGSDAALGKTIASRAAELTRLFARVGGADEFGVRVYRRDADVALHVDEVDPELAQLKREAAAASPGQRYLLERKIADRAKQGVRAAGLAMAKEVFETLQPLARASLRRPLVPEAGRAPEATLVLNAAFLVDRERLDAFRATLGEAVRQFQPRGLTFDFSGPWPPYNFVGDDARPTKKKARSKTGRAGAKPKKPGAR